MNDNGNIQLLTPENDMRVRAFFSSLEDLSKKVEKSKYPLIPTLWMIFEDSTFAFRSGDKHLSRMIYGK